MTWDRYNLWHRIYTLSIKSESLTFLPTFHSLTILLEDMVVFVLTLDFEICSCTNSILLKYYLSAVSYSRNTLTVLTFNSSVASSSHTIIGWGCICIAETVYIWFTPCSIQFARARALWAPVITMMTSLASMTVPTPTVSAILGTSEMSLLKNRELAMMVSYAFTSEPFQEREEFTRVLMRVREVRLLPGSLNAMCPSGPMPSN